MSPHSWVFTQVLFDGLVVLVLTLLIWRVRHGWKD
jgi:hypothetical protein